MGIVLGHRRTLQEDGLWKTWLTWAMARGAVLNETAKGTWVPKYVVDDEKWVMRSLGEEEVRESEVGPTEVPKPKREEVVETVDNWEDLDC